MDPLRGEVWDAHVRGAGTHPFVVLTINVMIGRPGSVTAALVTGSKGPRLTHVPIASGAGLTGHDESFVNATDLHTIPKPKLQRRRGRLNATELASLEAAVRIYLGL